MGKSDKGILANPDKHKDGGPDDYEADEAIRHLERAEDVKGNPELLKRVAKKAGRKMKALQGLLDKHVEPKKKKFTSLAEVREHSNKMARGEVES